MSGGHYARIAKQSVKPIAIFWPRFRPQSKDPAMERTIAFTLNGKKTQVKVDDERMLLWVLRSDLGLTGAKFGCGTALCGACTVIIDKEAVRSCSVPVKNVAGKRVLTIEGLSKNGQLHPLQAAFVHHNALQCGFCTPGMIMQAYALLLKNRKPTRAEIIRDMDNNLCRCGDYNRIVEAIQEGARATARRAS
jgi:carbon-monoxide dehydrogenase small subunit